MRIGIGLPQLGRFADIDTLRRVAIAAEASGLSSLWAIDRLLVPVNPRSAYPASADGTLPPEQRTAIDPIVALSVAATVTDRIRLGTSVLVAPWYPPVLLARALASVDVASAGRLAFGSASDGHSTSTRPSAQRCSSEADDSTRSSSCSTRCGAAEPSASPARKASSPPR
jgi:alkanesulfonate monooxygenase SsuD/methylene tetrahydromethanopterin reductase-like flavin-dependent oxidoreductase (luciferase family)